jgi:hypothetical protein
MIIKWNFEKHDKGHGLGFIWLRIETSGGHGNEHFRSIKFLEFLDCLGEC